MLNKDGVHKVEINQRSVVDVDIVIDGEKLNGISAIDISMRPASLPHVKLIPAVSELQFGDLASVEMYVDLLEVKTCNMLLEAICKKLKIDMVNNELTASEAVCSFSGWLSTRSEEICFGKSHPSDVVAAVVGKFIDANNLVEPRSDKWPGNAVNPDAWEKELEDKNAT